MKRVTLRERLRYAFENTMSRGAIALIGWLALFSLLVIVVAAALMALLRVAPDGGDPIAIGYQLRRHALDSERAYGVVVNPRKSESVTFEAADRIVVIAEE